MSTNHCRPHQCHHPLRIGSVVVHTCKELFMQPVEPARSARHLRAVS